MENGNGYERHAMSFAYDALTMETGLGLLVDSIKRGYDESQPIVRYEGAVLDGWNRYQASKIAEVTPVFVDFEGTEEEAIQFVLQHNSARRQMTKIQQAYAIRKMDLQLPTRKQRTAAKIAEQTGASKAQVEKAFKMHDEDPERAERVAEGKEPAGVAEQNAGFTDPPKTPGGALTCTNARIIKMVHAAMDAVPGFRERATEKQALNQSLELWAQARNSGGTLVVVNEQAQAS